MHHVRRLESELAEIREHAEYDSDLVDKLLTEKKARTPPPQSREAVRPLAGERIRRRGLLLS
jgi:hypothetical protein